MLLRLNLFAEPIYLLLEKILKKKKLYEVGSATNPFGYQKDEKKNVFFTP